MVEALDRRVLLDGRIFATVYADTNGNGVRDNGEDGFENVRLYVDLNRNGSLDAGEPTGLTDIDGELRFNNVPAGSRLLREVVPAGWAPSPGSPNSMELLVVDGEQNEVFFFLMPTVGAEVQGSVWHDLNGDGVRDVDDPGLEGWTIWVDLNDDRLLDPGEPSTLTDINGDYAIGGLLPGEYRVREILAPGWETTIGYDTGQNVVVDVGAPGYVDFGNYLPNFGAIDGVVWNDFNADGLRGVAEPVLGGWTVFIDGNANGVLDASERSAVTDPAGVYTFNNVPAGTYTIAIELQPDWNASNPASASQSVTVLTNGEATANFGVYTATPGNIRGIVWNDLDGDGSSVAEPRLEGWTVYVDLNGNSTLDAGEPSDISSADGSYDIGGVPAGSSVVRDVVLVGWTSTNPGTGAQLVVMPNGGLITNINFGNKQRTDALISGVAFNDRNRNNTRDAGEPGLSGITIYLDLNDNSLIDAGEPQVVTSQDLFYTPDIDEAGRYEFNRLAAGTYRVRQVVPALLAGTIEAERSRLVTLVTGEQRTNVNFADRYRDNELRGVKFEDINGNHQRDAGEPGIGGVVIYIDLDRDNTLDRSEPRTVTAADGTYSFTTNLTPGAYVLRELLQSGYAQTYPATTGGILWPTGTSTPAVGNVSPTSITTVLAQGETHSQNVSLTLPAGGGLTNLVDVFLLFDDTGSFTGNSPIVRAAFPQIISSLQAALPGIDLAFGVGRFEEYANFAGEFATGRPFILNQPVIASSVPGFSTAIQAALDRTAPGYGGDTPETDFEALYQLVTGRGYDGNNNGTTTESGAAGLVSTQLNPGGSGDVPAFASFTVDPLGNVLPASGTVGGAGFRPGALPVVLLATDTGFVFQPRGETSITGAGGLTLPVSALTQTSRASTPFNSGAGIQETITALNALGALVIGLGTNPAATIDPRQGLEALANLTGAINRSLTTIANGTPDAIAPGDPFYFQIASGFGASVANGIVAAISNAVSNVALDITVKASDPRVILSKTPGVVTNVSSGGTAAFDVTFTGDGRPHRFDLQFVRNGTNVVLGSIPVVIGTPIEGDGYEYEDLDEGEIDDTVDFGNHLDPLLPSNVAPSFVKGADVTILNSDGLQTVVGWATNLNPGSPIEANQLLTFLTSSDNPSLFDVQPFIDEDGTLYFSPAFGAVGTTLVTVRLHDSGGTALGGHDTSLAQTFLIRIGTATPLGVASSFLSETNHSLRLVFDLDIGGTLSIDDVLVTDVTTPSPVALASLDYDTASRTASVSFASGLLPSGRYHLTLAVGSIAHLATPVAFDFNYLQADANRDGTVGFADLLVLAQNYGLSGRTFSQGNLDYSPDGLVAFSDLLVLAQRYGSALPILATPMPISTRSTPSRRLAVFGDEPLVTLI